MSEKKDEYPLVYQVLNYVFGETSLDHRLLPVDRLLLILLAKYHGKDGIYPATKTLAKKLKITPTYVKERINYLDSINILKVVRKTGVSHHYFLEFLSTDRSIVADQSTVADRSTTVSPTGQPQFHDRSTPVDPINLNNQSLLINLERGRKKRRPALSGDFLPSEENLILARDLRLNIDVELESFKNRHKGKKTQYEFGRWLKTAKEYQTRHPEKVVAPQPKEWSQKDWEERDKQERALRAKESEEIQKQIEERNKVEYIPFRERVRMHNEKHGVLNNGATNTTNASNDIGGGIFSTKN